MSFHLAELCVSHDRHAEATSLYQKLLIDEHALPTSELNLNEARETCARALASCYLALRDSGGLEQAFSRPEARAGDR